MNSKLKLKSFSLHKLKGKKLKYQKKIIKAQNF
jgi:hypothetical protein